MKKLILFAILLIPAFAGADVYQLSSQQIVIFNRSTASDLVAFSLEKNGEFSENWLAGEEWPEVNVIEPGASSTFTHICSTTVYIADSIEVHTTWRDRETMEDSDLSHYFDPCNYSELYLTPEGEVGR